MSNLNLDGETFAERVDAMLIGTKLGGEKEMQHRMELFRRQFELPIRENARKSWKIQNKIREENGVPPKPFDFEVGKEQKVAIDLVTGLAICNAYKDPHNIAEAKYLFDYIQNKPVNYLTHRLDIELNLLDEEHKKIVSPLFDSFKNAENPDNCKLEALFLLRPEMKKEEERREIEAMYPEKGNYFYHVNIPVESGYYWGDGWVDRDKRLAFKEETSHILPIKGWKFVQGENGHADELVRGRSYVYIHPMSFSVFGRKKESEELIEHFQRIQPKSFKVGRVDMYPVYEIQDMTYREVYDAYKAKEKEIRTDILDSLDGKKGFYSISEEVYKKHRISNSAEGNMIGFSSGEIGCMFVKDVINDMINNKVLTTGKKYELKKVKRKIVVDKKEQRTNTLNK